MPAMVWLADVPSIQIGKMGVDLIDREIARVELQTPVETDGGCDERNCGDGMCDVKLLRSYTQIVLCTVLYKRCLCC